SSEDYLKDLVSHKQSGNPTFSLHKEIASSEVIHEFYESKGCEDSDFKDSIDQSVLTHYDDLFVDPTPEMFADEQPPDYSFPPRFDVYSDDFLEIESDANFDDDSFDFEGEKSKRLNSCLINLISLVIFCLSMILLILRIFPGMMFCSLLIMRTRKKLAVSFASWLSEDFDPLFSELLVFKEVLISMRLLPFSSENEEKFFKPGIYTFKKFHCCFLSELSHP
nr:hypothetical protein [Tanacetum cinerariifolium]